MQTTHELKCLPEQFRAITRGVKTFEVRRNDRNFQVGDILHLNEWILEWKAYTGAFIDRRVTYILQGEFGLPPDICVMAIVPVLPDAAKEAREETADEAQRKEPGDDGMAERQEYWALRIAARKEKPCRPKK